VNPDQSNENRRTLDAYEARAKEYLDNTPSTYTKHHSALLRWIDATLCLLPSHARILEIGSATPREAKYMRDNGFPVQCSDAAVSFVKYLRNIGEEAIRFNILEDKLPSGYNMLFANAVAQHFTPNDLSHALEKAYRALPLGGLFAFSVKEGKGDVWITEKFPEKRYIHYWKYDQLLTTVQDAGYTVVFAEHNIIGDVSTHKWINLTAQKTAE